MTDRKDIVERLKEGVKIGDIPLHGDPNITWAVPDVGEARKVMHEAASTIEDLAAALQRIYDNHMLGTGNMVDGHADLDEIAEIARAALSKARGEG